MNSPAILKKKYFLECFILFMIVLLYTVSYIQKSSSLPNLPTNWISMVLFDHVQLYYDTFKTLNFNNFFHVIIPATLTPGYLSLIALIMLFIGKNYILTIFLVNITSLILLLLFAYLLATHIKNRKTGIIMAIVLAGYPILYLSFSDFLLNFQLMWISTAFFYLLLKSNFFERRIWSILLALACVLGLLTKYTFAVYMMGPVIVALFQILRALKKSDYRYFINFLLFVIIVFLFTLPLIFTPEKIQTMLHTAGAEKTGLLFYSFKNLRIFTIGLWEEQLSPPFFILFIISLFVYFKNRRMDKINISIILWILLPNIILVLSPHWKSVRYFIPLLPPIAFITSFAIVHLMKNKWGQSILVLFSFFACLQYYDLNFRKMSFLYGKKIFEFKQEDIYYYHHEFTTSIWAEQSPKGVYVNQRIISRLKDQADKKILEKSHNGIPNYVPLVIVQPQYILNTDSFPFQLGWLFYLKSAMWLNNTDIDLFLLDDYMSSLEKKDPDFAITLVNEHWPSSDYGDTGFLDEVINNVFVEPYFMKLESKNPASVSWEYLRERYKRVNTLIKNRNIIFEETFDKGSYLKIYLYDFK